jgi:hypothetical protein
MPWEVIDEECGTRMFVCTADDPWTPEKGVPAMHWDAMGKHKDRCPNCGHTWGSTTAGPPGPEIGRRDATEGVRR